MDDAKVMAMLDDMDWNDVEKPESTADLEALPTEAIDEEEQEIGQGPDHREEEDDIDEILAEIARLKEERGEECAEISTSICSAPTLGISLSALEFNEWSRSMAKVDTDKIDNDIARERKNAQLPAGEEET